MKDFMDKLYDELQGILRGIAASQEHNLLKKATLSIATLKNTFLRLQEFIISYTFKDQAEEIRFFKKNQPDLYCLLIYYIHVANIEAREPIGCKEDQKQFFNEELNRIHAFFQLNQEAYKYYRLDETSHDEQYFLRDHSATKLPTEDASMLCDSRFSTEMGYKFARIKADEMLKSYLQAKLEDLETGKKQIPCPLFWQFKKVDLVEIIFLLHAVGAFGNLPLKTVVEIVTRDWNCPISNPYKTIEEIRIRKKERFPFAKLLINTGEQKMSEDDLNAR